MMKGFVEGADRQQTTLLAALRLVLAATLILVAGNLANRELRSSFANIAAFAPASAR